MFHFSSPRRTRQCCFDGIFQSPPGILAHNYFYKTLLQLLNLLPTSPPSTSPFLLCGCWNINIAKAPAVSALAVNCPAGLSVSSHGSLSANYIAQVGARMVFGQHGACWNLALCKHSRATQTYQQNSAWNRKRTLPQTLSRALFLSVVVRSLISLGALTSPSAFCSTPRG